MTESILEEAASLINGARKETYNNTDVTIAALWSAYLGTKVTALDYVNLMVLLKVARTKGKFHRDSYVDICGYAGLSEQFYNEIDAPAEMSGWLLSAPFTEAL